VSLVGTKPPIRNVRHTVAFGRKADVARATDFGSDRPKCDTQRWHEIHPYVVLLLYVDEKVQFAFKFESTGISWSCDGGGRRRAPTTTAAPAQAATGDSMRDTERFERRVELIRQSLDIPGMSVAVLHKQQVILARGFGVADVAKGTPATENTPYPIASLTKTFAAAVIMRLVESGKLDLDEAIATYDPGYAEWCTELKSRNLAPNYNCDSERITVRHHLTHTAQGNPGTAFEYNGFLFARLTAVINSVSPKEFNRAVEDDILTPLGMKDTALGSQDPHKASVISRMPKPYKLDQDFNVVESATFRPPLDYISAASGLISTVMDLAKYDVAIDRDMVYSPGAKQQTWTAAKSPTGQRFPYGLAGLSGSLLHGLSGTTDGTPMHFRRYCSRYRIEN
jgi:CubicO group peptidase (beta-lactamase class C family)